MIAPWIPTANVLPDNDIVVETKLDDEGGLRNVQRLQRNGTSWFIPSSSTHVLYTPTHWRFLPLQETMPRHSHADPLSQVAAVLERIHLALLAIEAQLAVKE